jgi:hypothetical protein
VHGKDQAARRERGTETMDNMDWPGAPTLFMSRLAFSMVTERTTWLLRRDESERADDDDLKQYILTK